MLPRRPLKFPFPLLHPLLGYLSVQPSQRVFPRRRWQIDPLAPAHDSWQNGGAAVGDADKNCTPGRFFKDLEERICRAKAHRVYRMAFSFAMSAKAWP